MSKKCYRYFGGLLQKQEDWLNKMAEQGYRLIRVDKMLYEFETVSYTHLDVYKRQKRSSFSRFWSITPSRITMRGRPDTRRCARRNLTHRAETSISQATIRTVSYTHLRCRFARRCRRGAGAGGAVAREICGCKALV